MADMEKVRVTNELRKEPYASVSEPIKYPSHDTLDRIAQGREIDRVRRQNHNMRMEREAILREVERILGESRHLRVENARLIRELELERAARSRRRSDGGADRSVPDR